MIREGEMSCKLLIFNDIFQTPLFHSPMSSASSDEGACFIIRRGLPHPATGSASSTDRVIRPWRDSNHEPRAPAGVRQTTTTGFCGPRVKPRQLGVEARASNHDEVQLQRHGNVLISQADRCLGAWLAPWSAVVVV